MRIVSSRGKSPQTTAAAIYETYEMERVREIEQQRAILRNELLLLHRTCENIALWNYGCYGGFDRYVLLVGFTYEAAREVRSLEGFEYAYTAGSPKLWLASYTSSHREVTLRAIKRDVPTEALLYAPLEHEMQTIRRELKRLDRMQAALYAYAPAGVAYRRILRRVAQHGVTRYHFRPHLKAPKGRR